jgi:hypothetical protein
MQKYRIRNKWDENTNSFDKSSFELKETEKMIRGKLNISSKQNDKFVSKPINFVLFKSKTDLDTQNAVKSCQPFEAEIGIGVDEFEVEGKKIIYHQIIINKAWIEGQDKHNEAKSNDYQTQDELLNDDEIAF